MGRFFWFTVDWVERKWLQNEGASAVVSGTTPQDPIVNCLENKNIKRNHDFDLTTINQASKQAKSSKQSINHSLYDHLWKINSFFCTSCSAGTKTAKFAGIEDGTMATCPQAFDCALGLWKPLQVITWRYVFWVRDDEVGLTFQYGGGPGAITNSPRY